MENEYFSFNPGTHTCRTPMPTRFEHLLGWVDKLEQYLTIHNQEDIVNINKLLETTLNLQISNIISRVIAQVIGEYKDGFVTIKSTEDGALHVYLAETAETLDILATLQDSDKLIGKVQIEGPAHTPKTAKISIADSGTHEILDTAPSGAYHITSIMFTVSDEVTVTLWDESAALSGIMNFGGTGQPMGMTHNLGFIPLVCTAGEKFQIKTVGDLVKVMGVITYYDA
ncbi:hypothetical protein ES703_93418 [subsurface metagenome]